MIPEIATVLMMPPSHSLEGEDRGRDEKVGKYCRDGLLGYGDDEVRVSGVYIGREGVERTSIVWQQSLHG